MRETCKLGLEGKFLRLNKNDLQQHHCLNGIKEDVFPQTDIRQGFLFSLFLKVPANLANRKKIEKKRRIAKEETKLFEDDMVDCVCLNISECQNTEQ